MKKSSLIIIFGLLLLIDSILTEVGILFFDAVELNPFYNIWFSLIMKLLLIFIIIYKRDYFTKKDLIIINIIPLLILFNNIIWSLLFILK